MWIVTVNYRTADLAVDCLHSVAQQAGELAGLRAVVVDNASGDGSAEKLGSAIARQGWQAWASMLPLDRNGGFAFGSNAGIRRALESLHPVEYIMLLNPDTVVQDGAIRALVDFMESHPDVGIAGSRLEDGRGEPAWSAHKAITPLGEFVSAARFGLLSRAAQRYAAPPLLKATHECDWVSAASLIVRRAVFEQIGLLDEGYFLYFEEVDFCLRARKAGWKVCFVAESRVVHFEGAATGIRDTARRRPGYWYDSRRRYFVKHFGVAGLLLADGLWAAGRASLALRRLLRLGKGGPQQEPKWFAFDLLWGDLRSLFTRKTWKISRDSAW